MEEPPSAESPFAPSRRYLSGGGVVHHLRGHYPSFIAPTGSCARPNPSLRLQPWPRRRVLAGCCQPLLGDGPSRRYLRNPCVGAWTHTPWCPPGAIARFFPRDDGFIPAVTSSAHQLIPAIRFQQGSAFRGCSHSFTFRLPRSLGPQVVPTAAHVVLGGRAPYATHTPVGYLPRVVVSLRVRYEQLTRRDFHPQDCGLVGRSNGSRFRWDASPYTVFCFS